MRNISFMMTKRQVRQRIKTVTRRMGWVNLTPGELLRGVEKCQGLKRGERMKRLAVIRVKSVRRERLNEITKRPRYGKAECAREGFADMRPAEFVAFFCEGHKGCRPGSFVTRIEFEYLTRGSR